MLSKFFRSWASRGCTYLRVLLALAVVLASGSARADLDFGRLRSDVEAAKTDFVDIAKLVVGVVGAVIVVYGLVATAKKMSEKDPSATWQLIYTAGGALLLGVAAGIF